MIHTLLANRTHDQPSAPVAACFSPKRTPQAHGADAARALRPQFAGASGLARPEADEVSVGADGGEASGMPGRQYLLEWVCFQCLGFFRTLEESKNNPIVRSELKF